MSGATLPIIALTLKHEPFIPGGHWKSGPYADSMKNVIKRAYPPFSV